jgi:hypothetical protein
METSAMIVKKTSIPITLTVSAVLAIGVSSFSLAKSPVRYDTVTATGDFPDQRITMPVRDTELGKQVRLPHGPWIYCKADCQQTLKDQTFNFWADQEDRTGGGNR